MVYVVFSYLLVMVFVLVGVAFVTLLERKGLGSSHIRVGPNFVGYWGILQPSAEAVKLFSKETAFLRVVNIVVYLLSPMFSLGILLIIWLLYPFFMGGIVFVFGLTFFLSTSSMSLYPIISSGWSSNCKYSIIGSLQAVAQMVSYEVSLAMVLLSLI